MGSLFVFRKMLSAFFFLFFIAFMPPAAFASIETGIAWLKAQQQPDGSFNSDNSLADSSQTTAEVLITLHQHKSLEAQAREKALEFLERQSANNLEWNVNALRINRELSSDLPVEPFSDYAGYSGGYGDYPGYDDSIYATAQLLASIHDLPTLQEINGSAALGYLISKQRSDKAWSEDGNNSSVVVTSLVNRALQQHRLTFNLNDKISTSTQYLVRAQAVSGGWGSILETAQALLAIIPAASTPSIYDASVQHLKTAQLTNGSWNNDPYTTAIALRVLYLLKNPPSVENQDLGSIGGTIKSETTGLPVAAARVDIAGPEVRQELTAIDGYFNALNLPSGNYVLTLTAAGYQQTVLTITFNSSSQLNLGDINLKPSVNAGLVHGHVTDAVTKAPLANVELVFIGSKKYFATTDANGFYSQEVDAGQYGVGFALPGYQPISKTINVQKSVQYDFSPQLRLLTETPLQEGFLYGTVSDPTAFTGEQFGFMRAVRGVEGATVQETTSGLSVQTDADGRFKIPVTPGVIKIVIQKEGFETKVLDGLYTGENDMNAGAIMLRPITGKLFGKVVDAKTGAAIPLAAVTAGDTVAAADANGFYQLAGLTESNIEVTVSAAGYESASYRLTVPTNDIGRLDFSIRKIKLSQIEMQNIDVAATKYGAYENVLVRGQIVNLGEEKESVIVQAKILDHQGNVVDQFTVIENPSGANQSYELDVDEQKEIELNWNTSAHAPGQYKVVLSAFSDESMRLLNEYQTGFEITPTAGLSSVGLAANISVANQGQSESLEFVASIRNQSNVPTSFALNMVFLDPDGNELYSTSKDMFVNSDSIFSSTNLGTLDYLFEKSGTYTLEIKSIEGVSSEHQGIGTINVVPNISINVEQSLTHGTAVPETDVRVKVKIRLEGTEVK